MKFLENRLKRVKRNTSTQSYADNMKIEKYGEVTKLC